MTEAPAGRLRAVCVVHAVIPDRGGDLDTTAIDKRPVTGAVGVRALGVDGDTQIDTQHHGGPFQAVYAYASEDAKWWEAELGRAITPGTFGENLVTQGVDVTGAVIGERWQVGAPGVGPILKVRSPRVPCRTFQAWLDEPQWIRRFTEHGAPGAYLSVQREGVVEAGDPIQILDVPEHGATVGDLFAGRQGDIEKLRQLVSSDGDLDPTVRIEVAKTLRLTEG